MEPRTTAETTPTAATTADRIEALLPNIHYAIHNALRFLSVEDREDALSEGLIAVLSRANADPTFLDQTTSYIVQWAVWAARHWKHRSLCAQRLMLSTQAIQTWIEHGEYDEDAPHTPIFPAGIVETHHTTAAATGIYDTGLEHSIDNIHARAILDQLEGTTRQIAAGIMAGLRKGEACTAAGVSKQAFTYHRKKIAVAIRAAHAA